MYHRLPNQHPATTPRYQSQQQQQQQRPVSKTDVLLFKQLANPTRTVVPDSASKLMQNLQLTAGAGNVLPQPRQPSPDTSSNRSEMFGAAPHARPPPMFGGRPGGNGGGVFGPGRGGGQQQYQRRPVMDDYDDDDLDDDLDDEDDENDDGLLDDGLDDDAGSTAEGGSGGGFYDGGDDGGADTPSPMMMTGGHQQQQRENVFDSVPMPSEDILDPEAERMQRQMYIQNLRQFQADGHVLSISLNDDTPTSALRSEFEVIQESIETTRGVKQLIMGVFVAIKIIEGLNKLVLRNMLPIDGLADHLKDNCSQELMIPLRRIHNMYFRNSFGNPFVQLGTAIAFSSISYMLSQDTGIISNLFSGVMSMLSPGAAGGQQQQAPPRQTAAAAAPPSAHHHYGGTTPFSMGSGFTAAAGGNNSFMGGAAGGNNSFMGGAAGGNSFTGGAASAPPQQTPVSFPSPPPPAFTRKIQPPPTTGGVPLGPKDKIPFQ